MNKAVTGAMVLIGVALALVGLGMGVGIVPTLATSQLGGGHNPPPNPYVSVSPVVYLASGNTVNFWANGTEQGQTQITVTLTVGAAVTSGLASCTYCGPSPLTTSNYYYHVAQTLSVGTYAVSASAVGGGVAKQSAVSATVTLVVTTNSVSSPANLVAAFSENQNAGTLSVTFTDKTIAQNGAKTNPAGSSWTVSDGTTFGGASFTHTFAASGTYSATERVVGTDAGGNAVSNQSSQSFTVWPTACYQCQLTLSAQFRWSTANLTATLVDYSIVTNGSITSYNWSFGDGKFGNGLSTTHTYARNGTFMVSETVTAVGIASTGTAKETYFTNITVSSGTHSSGCVPGNLCNLPSFNLNLVDGALIGLGIGFVIAAFVIVQKPGLGVVLLLATAGIGAAVGFWG